MDSKFNLDKALATMDSILRSGEVIPRLGTYTENQLGDARGAFMKVSVMVAIFENNDNESTNDSDNARAYDILLTQMYDLIAGQPLLLYFDWDGVRLRAVFNTTKKLHIDAMIDVAGKIVSLTDVINYKIYKETGIKFLVRTAINYGKVFSVPVGAAGNLMTGKIFGETENMLERTSGKRVVVSHFILQNLKNDYRNLFKSNGIFEMEYYADIVNIGMNNWLKKQIGKL